MARLKRLVKLVVLVLERAALEGLWRASHTRPEAELAAGLLRGGVMVVGADIVTALVLDTELGVPLLVVSSRHAVDLRAHATDVSAM